MADRFSKKLKPLSSGACIGLLATGSPLSPERWQQGLSTLQSLGFTWKSPFDPTEFYARTDHGFASASVEQRLKGFYELLQDRQVEVVLAVRGAYGTLDILPRIDLEQIRAAGKPFIGCSDVSVLLMQAAFRAGVPAIHGATLGSSFADYQADSDARISVDSLLTLLRDRQYSLSSTLNPIRVTKAGVEVRGPILAANLTMLLTLLGTPWDVDYQGMILVVEEVGEAPYRVHRAFTQLKLAGKLDRISGLVFGRFARCASEHGPKIEDVMQMIARDIVTSPSVPILSGLELGHWGKNLPLPLGCLAEIKGDRLTLLESPLQ